MQVRPDETRGPSPESRTGVLLLLMAFAGACHFNRVSMSVAGTERLMTEYSLSETNMGWAYSAYLLAYTIFMTPGGWLIDRFGPKLMLSAMGLGAGALIAATGTPGWLETSSSAAPVMLCAIRAILGIANVPIHPGAARSVSLWWPPEARPWANGMVTAAALVGIAVAYPFFGWLMDLFGWPDAFLLCGIATLVITGAWMVVVPADRVRSARGAAVIAGEIEDLGGDEENANLNESSWKSLALLTVSYASVGYFQYLFFYWIQYYFEKVLKLGAKESRYGAMIPMLAMAAGMVLGGEVARRLARRLGRWRGLALVAIAGMAAGAGFALMGIMVSSPILAIACFSLAMGGVGMAEGPFWTVAVEIGGEKGGTSAAIFNTGGNAGGVLAPVLTPYLSQYVGWKGGIAVACLFCLIGASLWTWITPASGAGASRPKELS